MIEKEWLFMKETENRKNTPVFTGVLKYFPDAIKEIARVSLQGNIQHHADKQCASSG